MYALLTLYILLLGFGTRFSLSLFGKQIQPADLFFVIVLIVTLSKKSLRSSTSIGGVLIIMLAFLFISSVFSTNLPVSIVEFISIFYLAVMYLWVSGIDFNERRFKLLLNVWVWMNGALCVLGLAGLVIYSIWGKDTRLVQNYPVMKSIFPFARIAATFPTMNMFASFLHVGVVFLLVLVAWERRRASYILPAVLIFICLLFTASRNLLGIAVTVFLAILPLKNKPYLSLFKYLASAISLVLFFLVTVTTIWCVFPAKINFNKENGAFSLSVNTVPSLYSLLNKMALKMAADKPFTGVGPGMFDKNLVDRLDWNEAKDIYEAYGSVGRDNLIDPHSTYLGWAAEAGIPFVLAVLGLFYLIGRLMWRGHRACADSFSGGFCYVCLCGLIGFAVNGFYIDILTMRHFWLMLGLGTMAAYYCEYHIKAETRRLR